MQKEPTLPLRSTVATKLAAEHDVTTLAAALSVRLLAEGRAELAGELEALAARALLSPNPPDPH